MGLVESTHGELQRRVNRIGTKQAGVGTALVWKKEGGRRVRISGNERGDRATVLVNGPTKQQGGLFIRLEIRLGFVGTLEPSSIREPTYRERRREPFHSPWPQECDVSGLLSQLKEEGGEPTQRDGDIRSLCLGGCQSD